MAHSPVEGEQAARRSRPEPRHLVQPESLGRPLQPATWPPTDGATSEWPSTLPAGSAEFVVVLAALVVLGVIAWSRIDKVAAIPDDHGAAVSAGRVYLLVGSDSREELTAEERAGAGTGGG